MNLPRAFLLFILFSVAGCIDSSIASNSNEPTVKQSKSGLCHDKTSASYGRTKNYTAYESLNACLQAGGRLPKRKTQAYDKAEAEAIAGSRDFVTLYNRKDWPHWIDDDGDCQNTRHELLISTSLKASQFQSEKKCNVRSGEWLDPYSGETFHDSKALDLDHIVPLKFAHGHGGDKWSRERKQEFANDRENLLLVKASLNRQKGAKGLTEWLPPNHQYRCEYISLFTAVMDKYGLSFIPAEQRIIDRMLAVCAKGS